MVKVVTAPVASKSLMESFLFNSPIGAYKKIGPPQYSELQERRAHMRMMQRIVGRLFYVS